MTGHLTFETLNDFADELLSAEEHAAAARHLAECASCGQELARLRRAIAVAAAAPREITPSGDLWPELRTRLAVPNAGGAAPARKSWFARFDGRDRVWLAAAALLLVAGSSAITAIVMRSSPSRTVATAAAPSLALPAAFMQTEAGYRLAVAELSEALDSARTRLAPSTVATIERSLHVIDQAISEARDALASDPGNQILIDVLSSSYERKLELLRRATEIPAKS
jgi:anti-sigma factor RsiW